MKYDNNQKHTNIAITISCILAILSIPFNVYSQKDAVQTPIPNVETKAILNENKSHKANIASIPIQKTEEVRKCDIDCKISTLIKIGITSQLANSIVNECKEGAVDPVHCIKVASSIVINESGGGKSNACKVRNNCFGFHSGTKKYSSVEEGTANFVSVYSRKWFKAKDMGFFYSKSGQLPPSRYCTSEDSSGSSIGCPIGLKHATFTFNKLNKIF